MKTNLLIALIFASLLAVILIPTGVVLAADLAPAANPAPVTLGQQAPAVQVIIALVGILFGFLAFAPLVLTDRQAAEQ